MQRKKTSIISDNAAEELLTGKSNFDIQSIVNNSGTHQQIESFTWPSSAANTDQNNEKDAIVNTYNKQLMNGRKSGQHYAHKMVKNTQKNFGSLAYKDLEKIFTRAYFLDKATLKKRSSEYKEAYINAFIETYTAEIKKQPYNLNFSDNSSDRKNLKLINWQPKNNTSKKRKRDWVDAAGTANPSNPLIAKRQKQESTGAKFRFFQMEHDNKQSTNPIVIVNNQQIQQANSPHHEDKQRYQVIQNDFDLNNPPPLIEEDHRCFYSLNKKLT